MIKKNSFLLVLFFGFFGVFSFAHAQQEMTEYPRVRLQSLDKATARTQTFNARVGATVKFGPLYIRTQVCKKSSPLEKPESTAFLQIWEVDTKDTAQWVFSGWMFASSPGLSSMDHPIYDVWVLDCLDYDKTVDESAEEEANAEPPPPEKGQDLLED